MNDQITQLQAQPRWGAILSAAPCGYGVRGFQIPHGPANQIVNRYSPAIKCWQCQQRAFTSLLALSVRGSRVDVQRHHHARLAGPTGAGAHLLYAAGAIPQNHELVRRDLGAITSSSRYGLRSSVLATRRVRTLARKNYPPLPENRTYEYLHRTENRTREANLRTENRTYGGRKRNILGPISVHLLDMPSVGEIRPSPFTLLYALNTASGPKRWCQ